MKTKEIPKLISELNELTSDFAGKTALEYKRLLDIADKTLDLVHGRRSRDVPNYRPLPIENELQDKVYELRKCLLKKIFDIKEEYRQIDLKECFEDFKMSSRLDYGSFGHGGNGGWSPGDLAKNAKDMLFGVIAEKLTEKLSSKKLRDGERTESLKMLKELQDHYNWSHENHKAAQGLLEKFDTKKEFIRIESNV